MTDDMTEREYDTVICRTVEALELAGYRVLPEEPEPEMLLALRIALGTNGMALSLDAMQAIYTTFWMGLPKMSDDWQEQAVPVIGDPVWDTFKGKVAEVPGAIVDIDEDGMVDIEWEGDNSDKINGMDPKDLTWDEERQGWLR